LGSLAEERVPWQFAYGQPRLEHYLWVRAVEAQRDLPAIEFFRVRQDGEELCAFADVGGFRVGKFPAFVFRAVQSGPQFIRCYIGVACRHAFVQARDSGVEFHQFVRLLGGPLGIDQGGPLGSLLGSIAADPQGKFLYVAIPGGTPGTVQTTQPASFLQDDIAVIVACL
jgi:hypothetical protein